ncbi:SnoaL-like domain protein [compost metagenome]
MNNEFAEQMIRTYFKSWVDKDFQAFLSTLHHEAVVRECTGAEIQGRAEHERWFLEWNSGHNKVEYWDIKKIGFDQKQSIACVEWQFACIYDEQQYIWDGVSIVYFRDSLIFEINEYEMKRDKFYPYRLTPGA